MLEQLFTRHIRPDDLDQTLAKRPDEIKLVTEVAQP